MEETNLILEAKAGSVGARNTLILRYYDMMRRAIRRVVGWRDADEFTSASVEGAVRAIDTFDVEHGTPFGPYLYRSVVFAAIRDRQRYASLFADVSVSRRKRPISPLDVFETGDAALARDCQRHGRLEDGADDDLARLRWMMLRLPDDLRSVLALRLAGWTLREIAKVAGLSVNAARAREIKAVDALRRMAGVETFRLPRTSVSSASVASVRVRRGDGERVRMLHDAGLSPARIASHMGVPTAYAHAILAKLRLKPNAAKRRAGAA